MYICLLIINGGASKHVETLLVEEEQIWYPDQLYAQSMVPQPSTKYDLKWSITNITQAQV